MLSKMLYFFKKTAFPPPKRRSVTISGTNSPEWFLADLGAVAADSVAVGVYPTNAGEAAVAVARDAETDVVVAEDAEQVRSATSSSLKKSPLPGEIAAGGLMLALSRR